MCGIAGIVALHPRATVDPVPMRKLLACVRHRGPDDEGMFAAPGIVLGHRRLAVIDVAHGRQPLHGRRDTTVVVANGEIYNYRELAAELRAGGSRFRTESDSEVVAHAWDAWGDACLDRFDGMFALAIWDGAARRLLLARDRMGEKPLYYSTGAGLLIFASELSALIAHPAIAARIDLNALRTYLALEYVPAPDTLVDGVRKLEPGQALALERGSIRTFHYWSIDPATSRPHVTMHEAAAELRQRLEHAVRARLVSDVPLGIFLSGGIDSSAIAALAARHGALETFSIGFDEPSFDESAYARAVAAHIGSRHRTRMVRAPEMGDIVPDLGAILDEPIGDASIVPTHILSRFAREHVTVALGGDGGDELFAGYPMHRAHRVAPIARGMPRPLLDLAHRAAAAIPVRHENFTFGFRAMTFLRGAAAPPPVNHGLWLSSFSPGEQARLLLPDVLRATDGVDPFEPLRRQWARSAHAEPLARATHLDATTYLPGGVLTKVDRASMAVALEVRAPFLARDVVEFAFAVPDRLRMRGLTGKRLLRAAVRDLLPAHILARPKKGFGMPVGAWLRGALRPLLHDLLGQDAVRAAGLFDPGEVQRLVYRHERGVQDLRKPLWTLLVLELWRRERIAAPVGQGARSAC
jgi:asparagine synthase (glutamine-hydrolysing)